MSLILNKSRYPTPLLIQKLRLWRTSTLNVASDELIIKHGNCPAAQSDLNGRHAEVVIDLTADQPTEERFSQGIISLVELLAVWDSRTILMGIPQFLQVNVEQLRQEIQSAAKQRLHTLDIRTLASRDELKKQSTLSGAV